MKPVKASQVSFANAVPTVSDAAKFVIRVPQFQNGGEPLVYPGWHEKTGQPILNYEGNPIGSRGIVWGNRVDGKVQGAPGDGSAIIIINQATEAQAAQIAAKVLDLVDDPDDLTLEDLKEVLAYVRDELGLIDSYNSDVDFAKKNFTPLGQNSFQRPFFGRFKRDSRDLCPAVRIEGPFEFFGVGNSEGDGQECPNGGVIVQCGKEMWAIQPHIFVETYKNPDGTRVNLDNIPVVTV